MSFIGAIAPAATPTAPAITSATSSKTSPSNAAHHHCHQPADSALLLLLLSLVIERGNGRQHSISQSGLAAAYGAS